MPHLDFWRCTRCGNVVAMGLREEKPDKCYLCRTGESELTDNSLYEPVGVEDL